MNKITAIIIIIVIIIGGIFFYMRNSSPSESAQNTTLQTGVMEDGSVTNSSGTTTEAVAPSTPVSTSAVKEFTVIGTNYSYSPSTITVKNGDTVKITFKDSDGFHNLVIDGYNTKTDTLESGDSSVIQFVANKTGTFAYYCSVDSHRAKGMEGKLIVK